MTRDYRNQRIWIVGASSGIGRALAVELSGRGAHLVLSARNAKELRTVNGELGGKHFVLPVDASKPKDVASAASKIMGWGKKLDGVIFMAGIYDPLPISEVTPAYAKKLFSVNVLGAFNIVHAALPHMKKGGQIALCASVAGWRGLPRGQPYGATKAALINYAESLRCENPGLDVRVINPGFVRTRLTDKNRFAMPMIIEPDTAAKIIADGLKGRRFDIHFPGRFTFFLRLLRIMPNGQYFHFVKRFFPET